VSVTGLEEYLAYARAIAFVTGLSTVCVRDLSIARAKESGSLIANLNSRGFASGRNCVDGVCGDGVRVEAARRWSVRGGGEGGVAGIAIVGLLAPTAVEGYSMVYELVEVVLLEGSRSIVVVVGEDRLVCSLHRGSLVLGVASAATLQGRLRRHSGDMQRAGWS
jgi:hypothetical protein